ncbi:transposase [Ralstonia syzygii]|uniref:transposase n=1 Tax=Ralstonia syzygii TaxID=28097 RepID=UPI0036F2E29B
MARQPISDGLRETLKPVLPVSQPSAKGGWPRVNGRAALNGIPLVLETGIPWDALPQKLGFGSGSGT